MNDQYDNLLPVLCDWLNAGKKVAIATLIEISGGSPRPVGAQLLVNDEGGYVGAISSGCVEADIILAASEVLKTGDSRHYNYGANSPFMDLTLPCGSSIKIIVNMAPPIAVVTRLCEQLSHRNTASITLDLSSGQWIAEGIDPIDSNSFKQKSNDQSLVKGLVACTDSKSSDSKGWVSKNRASQFNTFQYFVCNYLPAKRLIAVGKGVILTHVIEMAAASGLEVLSYSPDYLENTISKTVLNKPEDFNTGLLDSNTAVLVLFHDHDWEPVIFKKLLKSNASYIGALGSLKSHQQRIDSLQALGCSVEDCKKITSPAGLIQGTRHPQHIALSMVAQAVNELCSVPIPASLPIAKVQMISTKDNKRYALAH
jgi:xanthine dehydrogenase accessory factor